MVAGTDAKLDAVATRGRVLVVSNFYPPGAIGGAEVVAHRHALLLKARGWAVSVFAGTLPSPERPSGTVHVDEVDGIEVVRLALRSLDPDDNFAWNRAGNVLRALIGMARPDWLHAHNLSGLGVDLIPIARAAGVRVAVTLHDNWGYCFKSTRLRNDGSLCRDTEECHQCRPSIRSGAGTLPIRLRRDYVRYRLDAADLLISPSQDLADRYVEGGLQPGRIVVQSNGIDLDSVPSRVRQPTGTVRFLCAAYLGEHKGIPTLLRALRLLDDDPGLRGRWTVTIAGHGHLAGAVERAIAEGGWDGRVLFLGRRPRQELMEVLERSDVVVLPSSWPENEPVILLEAIASGAALLATRLGGNVDLVRDGETGLLCERDDPQGLADAMRRFIEAPATVERFSRRNLESRAPLREAAAVDRLEALFTAPPGALPGANPGANPVIACSGSADLRHTVLIDLLAKVLPGVQLLWHGWARPEDWDRVRAVWHWSGQDGIDGVAEALKRGLPVIVPLGPLASTLDAAGVAVLPYAGMRELRSALERVCAEAGPKTEAETRTRQAAAGESLHRFGVQLRDLAAFRLEAGP